MSGVGDRYLCLYSKFCVQNSNPFFSLLPHAPLPQSQASELCTPAFPVRLPLQLDMEFTSPSVMETEQLCLGAGGSRVCLCRFCFILVFPMTALGL